MLYWAPALAGSCASSPRRPPCGSITTTTAGSISTSAPSPKATRALLKQIEAITRVETGWQSFDQAVAEWIERVDEAVSEDRSSQDYVNRLEAAADAKAEQEIDTTDLAAEVEDFLRTLRDDETE